jgi:hypothetical protein
VLVARGAVKAVEADVARRVAEEPGTGPGELEASTKEEFQALKFNVKKLHMCTELMRRQYAALDQHYLALRRKVETKSKVNFRRGDQDPAQQMRQ